MATLTPQQLKKALSEAGFLVFRTQGDDIILAERVRENLIMDSGVRLRAVDPLQVRVVLKAQRADFPSDDEAFLFDRVRQLAIAALPHGFEEVGRAIVPIMDPSDRGKTLDTFYEIVLSKDTPALDAALDSIRFAMTLEKLATR